MYATSSRSDVYHLLTQTKERTLCGLSVVPIVIDHAVDTSGLHLTPNAPVDCRMCRPCADIARTKGQQG